MFGFSRLGTIDITCDAPSYKVVQACRRIGFRTPEDVRWLRISEFMHQQHGWKGLFNADTWRQFLRVSREQNKGCSCGEKLPHLDRVTFTFTTGTEVTFLLGQCVRCRSVFWDEA